MDGLSFVTANPPARSDPARADIACLLGFVARRSLAPADDLARLKTVLETLEWSGPALPVGARLLPAEVTTSAAALSFAGWLSEAGWRPKRPDEKPRRPPVGAGELLLETLALWWSPALAAWWKENGYFQPSSGIPAVDFFELRDVPVPVDTWETFDAFFAWDQRPVGGTSQCQAMLGSAVRSFFAQGGRKCYVVRLGDAWPVLDGALARGVAAGSYLPALLPVSAMDRATWRGLGHLFGLPDVSFLCLPDLPELFAVTPIGQAVETPPTSPEVFVECAAQENAPAERNLSGIPAPRCDAAGFRQWALLVSRVGAFLARSAREVQFIAAIPLPADDSSPWEQAATIRTAFVQLTYPWLRTRGSGALPGGVEAPDGVLAGLLANSALTRGSWRSALRLPVPHLTSVEPVLDRATLARDLSPNGSLRLPLTVRDRVTVVGPAPGGFRLLSDVTTADDESYRPASVNRLVCALIRAARVTGETAVFQNNGAALWARLRETLVDLLAGLWAAGALDGDSADEAFEVRCDRQTMTQSDLDDGRVVCVVSFTAAAPIVHVTVVLAMDDGGQVSLASREATPQPQAA